MGLIDTNLNGIRHAVSDKLIEARLLQWMMLESNKANWWVCGATHDGKIVCWDSAADRRFPYVIQRDHQYYALRVLQALHDLGLPGTWLVAWIDDCKRFYLLWKDRDGDIQIPIECDKSWLIIREWPMHTWSNMAMQAYAQWEEFHANMEYRPGQQVRLAAGEKPSLVH